MSAQWLKNLRTRYQRLVMVGVSYGAHGALLYGQLVPADEVIAISPIADVGAWTQQWRKQRHKKLKYDLTPMFAAGPVPRVKAFIGTGRHTELDKPSCDKLKLADVTVFLGVGHAALAKQMRDTGMFEKLLCEA